MASVPEAVPQDPIRRYSNTAVALHWVTVVIVLTQVVLGFAFAEFMAKGPDVLKCSPGTKRWAS